MAATFRGLHFRLAEGGGEGGALLQQVRKYHSMCVVFYKVGN